MGATGVGAPGDVGAGVDGGAFTEIDRFAVAVRSVHAIRSTVNMVVPTAVGVPEITPDVDVRVSPEGSEPDR